MIVCAGDIESFEFATPIGIGLIDSAINLTKIILEYSVDEIIFVGSAGSYGNIGIFDLVVATSAANIEHSFLNKSAYSPIKNKIVSHETDSLIVNSSNYITTDKMIANRYLDEGIDLENMEFYSVLNVAQKFGIKAKGIFVVTNYCDKNAHKDFITNHKKSKDILRDYVRRVV